MTELVVAFAAGAALGALYLAVLFASVRALMGRRTGVFLAGALARLALVGGAMTLFVLAEGTLWHLAAGLFGFLAARLAATRLVGRAGEGG